MAMAELWVFLLFLIQKALCQSIETRATKVNRSLPGVIFGALGLSIVCFGCLEKGLKNGFQNLFLGSECTQGLIEPLAQSLLPVIQ